MQIQEIKYSSDHFEKSTVGIDEVRPNTDSDSIRWFHISGVQDSDSIQAIGSAFAIHEFHQDDISDTLYRPKLDENDSYIFLAMKRIVAVDDEIHFSPICFVLCNGTVLSFGDDNSDPFNAISSQLAQNQDQIRAKGADYLVASLVDSIVDGYFALLDAYQDLDDDFETGIFDSPTQDNLMKAKGLKKSLIVFRQAISPTKDIFQNLSGSDSPFISRNTQQYFTTLTNSTQHIIDSIDTIKEAISDMLNIYLSALSIKMNNVMQVLTVISTIFIPLGFISGIYGMNFVFMPELNWKWAYPSLLAAMSIMVIWMLIYFRKKDWI